MITVVLCKYSSVKKHQRESRRDYPDKLAKCYQTCAMIMQLNLWMQWTIPQPSFITVDCQF